MYPERPRRSMERGHGWAWRERQGPCYIIGLEPVSARPKFTLLYFTLSRSALSKVNARAEDVARRPRARRTQVRRTGAEATRGQRASASDDTAIHDVAKATRASASRALVLSTIAHTAPDTTSLLQCATQDHRHARIPCRAAHRRRTPRLHLWRICGRGRPVPQQRICRKELCANTAAAGTAPSRCRT